MVATYREHGPWRGVPASTIMAEMYGKQEGCSRGRGGSMHLFDAGTRFYGGNAIVGGALPVAVGLALADKMQGRLRRVCCFFGEGAVAEGEFHESMNLAALWQLPVLFVCENNLYAMGTALTLSESVTDLTHKAASYAVAAAAVDGMDVLAVEAARRRSRSGARWCWTVLPGVSHLSFPGALDVRRGTLPRQSRGRGVETALSHPDVDAAFGGAGAAQRCGPHGDRTARRSRSRGGGGVRRSGDLGAGGGSARFVYSERRTT